MKIKQIKKIAILLIFLGIFYQIPQVSLAKTATTATKTQKKAKAKTPVNKNGDLAANISISEIFPNPKGIDTSKEWIELSNQENRNINLGNWTLSINKKPIKFNDKTMIKAHSYLVLESSSFKFSLPNNNCQIDLKDFVGKNVASLSYEIAEENLSFSLITIAGENNNITNWTNPTKGSANPIYYEISGEIKEKNINADKNIQSSMKITTADNQDISIYLDYKNNPELLNSTLKEKDQVLFLVEKNKEEKYTLVDFKIEKQNQEADKNTNSTETWLYYSLGLAAIIITYVYIKVGGRA